MRVLAPPSPPTSHVPKVYSESWGQRSLLPSRVIRSLQAIASGKPVQKITNPMCAEEKQPSPRFVVVDGGQPGGATQAAQPAAPGSPSPTRGQRSRFDSAVVGEEAAARPPSLPPLPASCASPRPFMQVQAGPDRFWNSSGNPSTKRGTSLRIGVDAASLRGSIPGAPLAAHAPLMGLARPPQEAMSVMAAEVAAEKAAAAPAEGHGHGTPAVGTPVRMIPAIGMEHSSWALIARDLGSVITGQAVKGRQGSVGAGPSTHP